MSSTFTLKDWTVYGLSNETAAPVFDAATNAFTLSPSLTDTAPIVYEFYDNLPDPGKTAAEVRNDLRFDLKLNLANNSRAGYSDFLVDVVTMPQINVTGDNFHPTLAHFHPATNATPSTLTQSTFYRIENESSAATVKPDLNGATRTHLSGDLVEPGETATWNAAKVHHWDGYFAMVITPIAKPTYYAPYGDAGNRLLGLNPAAPADGTQFAYETVVNQHYTPDVVGTARNDLLVGSDAESTITGGNGRDTALGRGGNDVIKGEADNDFLYGGDGLDTLDGGDGDDVLDGGADADSLNGGVGDDLVIGGAGNDTVLGSVGNDTVDGGLDNDTVEGGDGDDLVLGDYGNDTLDGGYGNDSVSGGFGDDTLLGNFGNDTLNGGENADRVDGGFGDDLLYGGFGLDTLIGADGNDTLYGGPDADLIVGDRGRDYLVGGEGADRFDFNRVADSGPGADRDVIEEFDGAAGDRFDVRSIDAIANGGGSNDAFTFIGAADFGGAAGQLRYAGGFVQADVNGDRAADFEVQLLGDPTMQQGWFYL